MIKLTKSNINTLIAKYFEDEGYVYSKFTFTAECKVEMEHLRKNIDLVSLVAMGLQYLYGVEHFKENCVTPCDVLYSLVEEHRCETVERDTQFEIKLGEENVRKGRPRKRKREVVRDNVKEDVKDNVREDVVDNVVDNVREDVVDTVEIKDSVKDTVEDKLVEDKLVEDKPVEDKLVDDKPVEDKPVEDDSLLPPLLPPLESEISLEFSERPLTECKEAERISWNGDYLAVKTNTNELFAFRFGCFIWKLGIANISSIHWNELGLVTGEAGGRVAVLNPHNYRRKVFEKHSDCVTRLFFRNRKIYSCSKDGYIFSTDDSFSLRVFPEGIKDALLVGDSLVFCYSFGGSLAVGDLRDASLLPLEPHSSPINSLDSWEGVVSTGGEDGSICLYDSVANKQVFFKAHSSGVAFQCWVGGCLTSAGKDNTIKLWDAGSLLSNSCAPLSKYKYPGSIKMMKSSKDYLALISDDQTISFFDKHLGLISRYSLVATPKDFDFSEAGDSVCVLLANSYPVIINLMKSSQLEN